MRVALYSHDTMGLGHMRRNLAIAQALAESRLEATVLIVAGAKEASAFPLPERTECLALPAYSKQENGGYRSRSLGVPLENLVSLRARTILAAIGAFGPDVLIVDKVPRGALAELEPTLESLRLSGDTRCILGLRDVLDDPNTVAREWQDGRSDQAMREYYDGIWVYGDPAVYDPLQEYRDVSRLARMTSYTGYLARRGAASPEGFQHARARLGIGWARLALCLVGGGQDGARLAEAFARAELPDETAGVIVTGPFMPDRDRRRILRAAVNRPRLRVLDFVPDLETWIRHADRIVSMGGYNTVCEILSARKRALIVPRVEPRQEQRIRAERLQRLGLADAVHPSRLHHDLLTKWLASDQEVDPEAWGRIDLAGLSRLPQLLADAAEASPAR